MAAAHRAWGPVAYPPRRGLPGGCPPPPSAGSPTTARGPRALTLRRPSRSAPWTTPTTPTAPQRGRGQRVEPSSPEAFPPDGDLTRALAGDIRLDALAACKEGWARTAGMKPTSTSPSPSSASSTRAILFAIAVSFYLGGLDDLSLFTDPEQMAQRMAGMATNVGYISSATVLMAPSTPSPLAMWNLGLRRAAGHDTRIGDAFPLHRIVPATLVMFLLAPLGFLQLIHPVASYLGFPFWVLVLWTLPLFLDRQIGIVDAIRTSARLTVHNVAGVIIFGVVMVAGYIASILTPTCPSWWRPWGDVRQLGSNRSAHLSSGARPTGAAGPVRHIDLGRAHRPEQATRQPCRTTRSGRAPHPAEGGETWDSATPPRG